MWPQWLMEACGIKLYEASAIGVGLINLGLLLEARARVSVPLLGMKILDSPHRRRAAHG